MSLRKRSSMSANGTLFAMITPKREQRSRWRGDDAGEFLRLGLDELGELLRRAPVGAGAHGGDVFLDVVALQHRLDLLVEFVDDGPGAAFGRKMPNQEETSKLASSGPASRMVGR